MSESSSSCELVRLHSNPLSVEWEACPETTDFKLRIKKNDGKSSKLLYTLKEGAPLPYKPVINSYPGLNIFFSKAMKPVFGGRVGWEEKGYWIFEGPVSPSDAGKSQSSSSLTPATYSLTPASSSPTPASSSPTPASSSQTPASSSQTPASSSQTSASRRKTPDTGLLSDSRKTLSELSKTPTSRDTLSDTRKTLSFCTSSIILGLDDVIEELDIPGLAQYKCKMCSFVGMNILECRAHCEQEHPEVVADSVRSVPEDENVAEIEAIQAEKKIITSTPHTNPHWLIEIRTNYKKLVISKCSQRTRQSVTNNEKIKDPKKNKFVSDELINTTIDHLGDIFGGVGTPKLKDMREIAGTIAALYPAMFGTMEKDVHDYETDGEVEIEEPTDLCSYGDSQPNLSLNDLAQKMVYRFRDRVRKAMKREVTAEVDEETPKRGKRAEIYGVDNSRFTGKKISAATVAALARTADEDNFATRETIFEKNRPEIQYQFRNSSKNVSQTCRKFFDDHLHLANHFKYLTKADDLIANVRKNLHVQIGYLEQFLTKVDQSLEMRDKLAAVDTACDVEYQGSRVYKDIHIIRMAGDYWDSNVSALMRLKEDGAADNTSPFILAVQVDKVFVFEVWCERSRLLGPLDMSEAIASFLHLAFVFNFKYPKGAQTISDILQRRFAKYGDESGTRTHCSKSSAQSKLSKYLNELGKILSE